MLSQYIAHSQLITDSYIYFHHARKKISLKRTKGITGISLYALKNNFCTSCMTYQSFILWLYKFTPPPFSSNYVPV